MIIVEGKRSIHIASAAWLVEENRELAWAQKHVISNPAFAWVLGKYVGTNKANLNGHIFDANELADCRQSLIHAPMNMLHVPHQIMGTYVANEVIWPTDAGNSATVAAGHEEAETEPYLEALAAFYKYYFPDAFIEVEKAHKNGTLAWSMECVPRTVTCAATDHPECGKTFDYNGRQSETYCDHLNQPAAPKKMGKPHFTAGALVIPPATPAWRNATVTELSSLLRSELEAAENVHEQVKQEFPDMAKAQWESLMLTLLGQAAAADAKDKGKHAYAPVNKFIPNAVCKVCGKKAGGPMHTDTAKAEEIGRAIGRMTVSARKN